MTSLFDSDLNDKAFVLLTMPGINDECSGTTFASIIKSWALLHVSTVDRLDGLKILAYSLELIVSLIPSLLDTLTLTTTETYC